MEIIYTLCSDIIVFRFRLEMIRWIRFNCIFDFLFTCTIGASTNSYITTE